MARDLSRFVGIPYIDKGTNPARGLDCWQLVRYFYAEELNKALPDYMCFYDSSLNMQQAAGAIEKGLSDWQRVERQVFGNVVVFRIVNSPWHTGVVLDDGMMLHTDKAHGSVIEPLASLRWRHRNYGAFEWRWN